MYLFEVYDGLCLIWREYPVVYPPAAQLYLITKTVMFRSANSKKLMESISINSHQANQQNINYPIDYSI